MIEILLLVGGFVAVLATVQRFRLYEARLATQEARIGGLEAFARMVTAVAPPEGAPPPRTTPPTLPQSLQAPPDLPRGLPDLPQGPWDLPQGPPPLRTSVPPTGPASVAGPASTAGRPASHAVEDLLGGRWAVWVGGVALALGGVFLVRYSIEQELIGPGLRVAFGFAFAAGLVVVGEILRRRETPTTSETFRVANIPAILTAAGTSTAFATVYAAYGLYDLIGPGAAFVLLGLVSLLTMTAALLHGPALAGLGLVAALAAPVLVKAEHPSPYSLVLYLVFAVGAAYAVARLRLWRWLAIAAAAGGLAWGWAFPLGGTGWVAPGVAYLFVQLTLALLFLVVDPHRRDRDPDARADGFGATVLFGFAILAVVISFDVGSGALRTAFALAVTLMLAAAAFRFAAAAPALGAAALAGIGTLAIWPVAREIAREPLGYVRDLAAVPLPDTLAIFLTSALAVGVVLAAAGFGRLALGRELRAGPAGWYAGAATIGPLLLLVVVWWRMTAFDASVPFALVAAGVAAAYAVVAAFLARRDPDGTSPAVRLAVAAAASAAVAALAAGLTFAFEKGVLTVTLALAALGTAIVADRLRVPALRLAVGALGVAVAARLAWDPTVVGGDVGATPIVNWLLWGYGVPALAFGLAARILARSRRDWAVRFTETLSLVLAALLIYLEIRHALYDGHPFARRTTHLEAGLAVTESFGFALLALRLELGSRDPFFRIISFASLGLAVTGALSLLVARHNPYLSGDPVLGGPIVDSLLAAYLIPAAMTAWLAVASRAAFPRPVGIALSGLALLLELAWAFLEVRHLFQGEYVLRGLPTSQAELWCYTAVLLVNAAALLAAGLLWQSRLGRLAAALCFALAVAKVFVFDLSAMQGLARALSFVGLGLVLVAVGYVYQRIAAAKAGPTA